MNFIYFFRITLMFSCIATINAQQLNQPHISNWTPQGAVIGQIRSWAYTHGDTWISTWAPNNNLYAIADDTQGPVFNSNLAIYSIIGNHPYHLKVEQINPMKEYGANAERGTDGNCWKACGIICIDSILYVSISRHDYPWAHNPNPKDMKQTAQNASIIKSVDYGKTWTRNAPENLQNPMFPNRTFATPFFIEYGKNGKANVDNANKYVYAISNDGFWNNGNYLILGRVERGKLSNLNGADWEYYSGTNNADGMLNQNWTRNVTLATQIVNDSNKLGMSAITYIEPLQLYILGTWHYMPNFFGGQSFFKLRCSKKPWGPWEPFYNNNFNPEDWYNPSIISKFTLPDGLINYATVSGNFGNIPYYKFTVMPILLHAKNSISITPLTQEFTVCFDKPQQIDEKTSFLQIENADVKEVSVVSAPKWLNIKLQNTDLGCKIIHKTILNELIEGEQTGIVTIKANNAYPQTISYYVWAKVYQTIKATQISNVKSGLKYSYFELDSIFSLPNFSNLKPQKTGICNVPEIHMRNREKNYAMLYQGYIKIPESALYRFVLKSDDAAKLFINDNELLYTFTIPMLYNAEEKIYLQQGYHKIRIEYFKGAEPNAVLDLSWQSDNIPLCTVPIGYFYHDNE